jgi:hypothetical protein
LVCGLASGLDLRASLDAFGPMGAGLAYAGVVPWQPADFQDAVLQESQRIEQGNCKPNSPHLRERFEVDGVRRMPLEVGDRFVDE